MPTITDHDARLGLRVAEAIVERANGPIDAKIAEAVRIRLLHATGVALVGTGFAPFRDALRTVDGSGTTPALANRAKLAPADAAFVNAIAAHSSLQEDCGPGGFEEGSHPGTYIVPAALAAAHATHASGERLVRGLIAGYEAVGVLGRMIPVGLAQRKFRPVGVMGPFGAAAAVSTILGADSSTLARALGIASNLAGGVGQGFISGTSEPYLHAGFAARNGYVAASLAINGLNASADALDGQYGFFAVYAGEAPLPQELSSEAAITRLGSKKYAVCLQNQETLELATELRADLGESTIDGVRLYRPQTSANGTASPGVGALAPFDTMLQRQMSARYSLAAALLGRAVEDPRYFAGSTEDVDVTNLAHRVEIEPSESDEVRIEVRLEDGTRHTIGGRRSHILFPAEPEVHATYLARATSILGADVAQRSSDLIRDLPHTADAAMLTEILSASTRSLEG